MHVCGAVIGDKTTTNILRFGLLATDSGRVGVALAHFRLVVTPLRKTSQVTCVLECALAFVAVTLGFACFFVCNLQFATRNLFALAGAKDFNCCDIANGVLNLYFFNSLPHWSSETLLMKRSCGFVRLW